MRQYPGSLEFLFKRTEKARPDMHSVAKKIGTCRGVLDQEFAEPSTSLASITCSASSHQVPTRLITLVSPRLNVVGREIGRFKYLPAIDTPPAILVQRCQDGS